MKWISIKKRLPELNVPVLVYGGTFNHPCERNEMVQAHFYKMCNCDLIVCSRDDMYWKATDWAPLPLPPSSHNSN